MKMLRKKFQYVEKIDAYLFSEYSMHIAFWLLSYFFTTIGSSSLLLHLLGSQIWLQFARNFPQQLTFELDRTLCGEETMRACMDM